MHRYCLVRFAIIKTGNSLEVCQCTLIKRIMLPTFSPVRPCVEVSTTQ